MPASSPYIVAKGRNLSRRGVRVRVVAGPTVYKIRSFEVEVVISAV